MDETALYDSIHLSVYNSLTRSVEPFQALDPPFLGMYVCGPTVYSDPHLGHARTGLAFDTVFRFMRFIGYRVRYVRNITDVGHLEDEEAGAGEDKIAKRARLERLEPMEVVQRYTLSYHDGMRRLGCMPPSIEPRASGHVIEQIETVRRILDADLAYESSGSVYFDLEKYARRHGAITEEEPGDGNVTAPSGAPQHRPAGREHGSPYGRLSGRVFGELKANTRGTAGSEEKRSPLDFALWKRAEPEHIMRWPSPWGEGFPGWHIECTTMSTRYLGEQFDIHGGGLDLQFPHHEAEIAQNHGAYGRDPARYWLHANMLTVDGRKMAKSLGNFITLEELFTGNHEKLSQAFSPMVVRFFMLQSHYRSTVDFSDQALIAAERGYHKLMGYLDAAEHELAEEIAEETAAAARGMLERSPIGPRDDVLSTAGTRVPLPGSIQADDEHAGAIASQIDACWRSMADDFHTPRTVAALFELGKLTSHPDHENAPTELRRAAARVLRGFVRHVLGLQPEREPTAGDGDADRLSAAMNLLISMRAEARAEKDFARADRIRDTLAEAGIRLEDGRNGTTWVRD